MSTRTGCILERNILDKFIERIVIIRIIFQSLCPVRSRNVELDGFDTLHTLKDRPRIGLEKKEMFVNITVGTWISIANQLVHARMRWITGQFGPPK